MRVNALKPDEIEVECELRGILSGSADVLVILQQQVDDEKVNISNAPRRMHSRAAKNPNTELEGCRNKLKRLRDEVTNLKSIEISERTNKAEQVWSRLVHVRGRLERVSSSPTYQNASEHLLQACVQLLQSVEGYLNNSDDLDNSIKTAEEVEMDFVIPVVPETHTNPIKSNPPIVINPTTEVKSQNTISSAFENFSLEQNPLLIAIMTQLNQLSDQVKNLSQKESNLQIPNLNQVPEPTFNPGHNPATVSSNYAIQPQVRFHDLIANPTTTILPLSSIATASSPTQTTVPTSSGNQQTWNYAMAPQNNSTFNSRDSDRQIPIPSQSVYHPNTSERRQLSRSGISYSGSPSGIAVDMFFFQLETVAASMKLSEESLLMEMSTVLKEVALQWYWTYRRHNPLASWSKFKFDFIERFKDRRTDFEIRRSIESRKQQANENFIDFYHHIWSLTLQCRIPYRDEELIQLLISNMKPALQYHLTDRRFTNINDLIKSCIAWEDTFKRFRVSPDSSLVNRRAINELYTNYGDSNTINLAEDHSNELSSNTETYESVSALQNSSINRNNLQDSFNTSARIKNRTNTLNMGNNPVCYNCSDIGHTFVDCPVPPSGLFCYRCGLKGTITPRCLRCAGNAVRCPLRSGNQGPPKPTLLRPIQEETATNTDPEFNRLNSSKR